MPPCSKIILLCFADPIWNGDKQWRNSRGGGGQGAECPLTLFHRVISADLQGKERQGKKGENKKKKKKENRKREGGKLIMEGGEVIKWGEGLFFSFAFHFSKPLKFVLRLPRMGIFFREKSFHARKKSGNITLPPLKNIPLMPLVIRYLWSKDLSLDDWF